MIDPIRRAEHAKKLLDHPLMTEAREHMRESLTRAAWKRHDLADADRAKLDAYMRHFGDFFMWFERVLQDGRVAEADLQAKSKLAQIAQRVRNKI